MSQENVEIVRGYWEVVGRLLDEYWANPDVPLTESPLIDDMGAFDLVHPDAEWTPAGQLRTAHGREEWLRTLAEGLDVVEYWRPAVEDVIDGGNDEVVAVVRVSIRGQGSGIAVSQQIFSVVTVREGQIARISEYTDRAGALEAAGLRE
jgi:ketosteroid isomerase-like protein